MTIATGIAKQLRVAPEVTLGVLPNVMAASLIRRVTSDLNLTKQTYQSQEIRSDYQVADFRHGARSVQGSINGELSCSTFQMFLAAALRKTWVSGASFTGTNITATTMAPHFVRATGSWINDGFKVGDVIRCSGWTTTGAANNARNYRITALTATNMTVADMTDTTGTVAAKASGDSVTIAVAGKKLWVPTSGHTNPSFSIEHWHTDILQSERFVGCRVGQIQLSLPATGMATIATSFLGIDMTTDVVAYFSAPTAETETGCLAAVNGRLRVGGTDVLTVTGLNMTINGNMTGGQVIGSNISPDIFPGRVVINGQLQGYFETGTLRDDFLNETEISLHSYLTASNSLNSPLMALTLPRIKLGSASLNDGEQGLVRSYDFMALLNVAGGSGTTSEETTISIQDSEL